MSIENSSPDRHQKISKIYGIAQTAILCIFTGLYLFDTGAPIILWGYARVSGGVLCALGLLFIFTAFLSIGKTIQIAPQPKTSGHLVSKGIYRYFRHPIYTGILLVVIGLFLRKPTLLVAIVGLGVILFLLVKVRFEEKLLAIRYSEYAEYRKTAWGVIPGL
jgi:protein-S-isoprenylcysteine O-methyltransferase Ste14